MKTIKSLHILFATTLLILSCGSSDIISTPTEQIDNTPLKFNDLTETEEKNWSHLDLVKDTIPGMSIDKAYNEIIKKRKGETVVVAVIDSGIDIDHEDLKDVIWINEDEIPNNSKDDDNNGYIDDINGWNFLGDADYEQLEFVRLLASGNTNHLDYSRAQKEYSEEFKKYSTYKTQYEQITQQVNDADKEVSSFLNNVNYTKDDVFAIKTEKQSLLQSVSVLKYMYSLDFKTIEDAKDDLSKSLDQINEHLDYHLNKNLNGRKIVGDDPNDINDKVYGDGNVSSINKIRSHGTHVAGIIAAKRNNNLGMNGVANNVKIMTIRNTPNGDEYDKDVALAIRYAVDNGAQIINMSFGKYYSPHSDWVRDAIAYAGKNNVLIVHGAGNDALNLDKKEGYPSDQISNKPEVSNTFINVGAVMQKYGSTLVADYSNYGKITVDVFAPGSKIYSTIPGNKYEFEGGTSMASPAVAGVAALIMSYYPDLTAAQVKQILMDSGIPIKTKVVVGGNPDKIKPFGDLSKSAKLVNAYNALIMAKTISKN